MNTSNAAATVTTETNESNEQVHGQSEIVVPTDESTPADVSTDTPVDASIADQETPVETVATDTPNTNEGSVENDVPPTTSTQETIKPADVTKSKKPSKQKIDLLDTTEELLTTMILDCNDEDRKGIAHPHRMAKSTHSKLLNARVLINRGMQKVEGQIAESQTDTDDKNSDELHILMTELGDVARCLDEKLKRSLYIRIRGGHVVEKSSLPSRATKPHSKAEGHGVLSPADVKKWRMKQLADSVRKELTS